MSLRWSTFLDELTMVDLDELVSEMRCHLDEFEFLNNLNENSNWWLVDHNCGPLSILDFRSSKWHISSEHFINRLISIVWNPYCKCRWKSPNFQTCPHFSRAAQFEHQRAKRFIMSKTWLRWTKMDSTWISLDSISYETSVEPSIEPFRCANVLWKWEVSLPNCTMCVYISNWPN